ncbi:MAG: hypothetical protein J7J76_01625 [Candidatus Latescibacteria bacterium]|nr:hypothetical protein [Candidatus Latescibacterota bacterium]
MSVIEKLRNIDRRFIFVAIALTVIVPLLRPIGFPIAVSPSVQRLYDAIEQLPPGSKVLMSFDYDPSTMPEVYPMNLAIAQHCFSRNLKVVGIALWPMGVSLGQQALETAAEECGKLYGTDYVNLGYKTGGMVVILAMGRDLRETFPEDFRGTPIEELPIMEGVRNLNSFKLVVDFSAGDPGVAAWVMIAQARYHKKVGAGCTAVSAPAFYPYLNTGQLVGLLGGMKGAAEYEKLLQSQGPATAGMDAQSIAHAVIIFFILFGNLVMLITKRKTERRSL